MKVGTLCYATDQGLGVLAKAFYDNGVVTHPVVVKHTRHETHSDWYPGAQQVYVSNVRSALQTLASCDVVLFFETPFDWSLLPELKCRGVRTVLMPMHECMPARWPARPDAVINPSALDQECFPEGVHLPVPVAVQHRARETAVTFVHNAGHGGLRGRNGTAELLEAWKYVRSDAKLLLRSQKPLAVPKDSRIEVRMGTAPYEELFAEGDAFVFPEKFNGLSLPMQEATAAGMLVLATDRFPNNKLVPPDQRIPKAGVRRSRIGPVYREFDEAILDPRAIAAVVDSWYGKDISLVSALGLMWAQRHSWTALKPCYMEALRC